MLDEKPVSRFHARIHGSLVGDGSPSEFSGAADIKTFELGRIVLERGMLAGLDDMGRQRVGLDVACELAPNVYESPLSALVLGIAQDVFLCSKFGRMLSKNSINEHQVCFKRVVKSDLAVPDLKSHKNPSLGPNAKLRLEMESEMSKVLWNLEAMVFKHVLNVAFSKCRCQLDAERLLSAPVADFMQFKKGQEHAKWTFSGAFLAYLNAKEGASTRQEYHARLLDNFQNEVRNCPKAIAPTAAVGRAYFNSQFRDRLCEALFKNPEPADIATFDLKVRAYRDARAHGRVDAPVDYALVNRLHQLVPEDGQKAIDDIYNKNQSAYSMPFAMDDLN